MNLRSNPKRHGTQSLDQLALPCARAHIRVT